MALRGQGLANHACARYRTLSAAAELTLNASGAFGIVDWALLMTKASRHLCLAFSTAFMWAQT